MRFLYSMVGITFVLIAIGATEDFERRDAVVMTYAFMAGMCFVLAVLSRR